MSSHGEEGNPRDPVWTSTRKWQVQQSPFDQKFYVTAKKYPPKGQRGVVLFKTYVEDTFEEAEARREALESSFNAVEIVTV